MEKYTGVQPEGYAKYTKNPEYSHTEKHGNKEVNYFHTWRQEPETPHAFRDNEEPNRSKIRAYDILFRFFLACLALWFCVKVGLF